MSFFRKLFGDGSGGGRGERPLAVAKPELLRLLRERGARSALIAYDGGHDEGGVTEIWISTEPLGAEPRKWSGDALPNAQQLEVDWDEMGKGGLLDAAMDVVSDKWGGFAGEFFVKGRLVVDVDAGSIARHDDAWLDEEGEDIDEDYDEDAAPKRSPDMHEVENV
jgi:hypothetical protein